MNKILIIGGGSIGKRHLRNLISLGEKEMGIVEVNQERRLEIAKEFKIEVYTSWADAWENGSYNIVFVCTPAVFHMEQALVATVKGCHLFVEKPLSHSLEGAKELVKIIEDKKLITMVGSNWKFYPLFKKMKELLDANKIGKVFSARCQFGQYLPDWHPWEDYRKGYSANKKLGGGILLDSHEFDYLTWFLGDVKKLSCFTKKVGNLEIDVEDVAEVILEFKNGALGEIHLDYLQRFYQRNFEFFGEQGTIIWDTNLKKVTLRVKDKIEEVFELPVGYNINDMYVEEIRHFLQSVERQKETITPVSKGGEVLKLIMAAKQSALEDRSIKI